MRAAAAGAALLSLSVMAGACSFTSPGGVAEGGGQIVVAGEFTASQPDAGDADRAAAIAIAEHPTLDGYRLVYESFDDTLAGGWDVDKALQNVKRMVREGRILAVVGPWNSGIVANVVATSGQANLVMLSPSTTRDCLTARPQPCVSGGAPATNFFRISGPNAMGGRAEADFAIRKLGLTRFAVLNDGGYYGTFVGDSFAAEVGTAGGSVVLRQTFSPFDQSYAALLRQARDAGAQALFVGSDNFQGTCRLRGQMTGVFSTDMYMFSGESITGDPACVADAGKAADDHLVGFILARQPAAIPAALHSLPYGNYVDPYVFAAYDCAEILAAAIDRAIKENGGKIPTRMQVVDAVAATHEFKGITGTYSFLPNGDTSNPGVSLYFVRNGKWTFWQNI
jgi:branched-chain amino acid transport system substrate-binding protein